jgi:hypothetical protein
MAGPGGARKGAGRKSNATKLLEAQFLCPWFTERFQTAQWNSLLSDKDSTIRLNALKYLTDRVYGRARESIDQRITGADGGPLKAEVTVKFVKTGHSGGD